MNRIMCAAALMLTAGLSTALAQSEAEILIDAAVESELILTNVDGTWGLFSPGQTYVITPGSFKEPPGPGEGAGILTDPVGFELEGNPGSDVLVSLVLPGAFLSESENGALPLSNWTYGWNYDNDNTVAFVESGPIVGSAVTVTVGGDALVGIFLGATVTVPTSAFPDTYIAQVIGSAAYTGN